MAAGYQSQASTEVVQDTASEFKSRITCSTDIEGISDRGWEAVQERTFTKWSVKSQLLVTCRFTNTDRVNTKLAIRNIEPISDLSNHFSDGVKLILLLEIIGNESLGRYNRNPKMRVQKAENVVKALEFIKSRGVSLTNIGPEDIVDGNRKLICGMIWTLILRFTIADITEEGLSAKEGLLLWCQRKTAPYKEVNVKDFTYSWKDGLAFCALIHRHRPDLLDFYSLDMDNAHGCTALAFDVAARHLNIPQLLEVEDVCDVDKPDERSVMTYVAEFFHAFSNMDQVETAGRRLQKFADVMRSVWEMSHDYESRVKLLMEELAKMQSVWATSTFDGTYTDAKHQSSDFIEYKGSTKRLWIAEKTDLDSLLGNIQTKLKTYELLPYTPPVGLALSDLELAWSGLVNAEAHRSKLINAKIRDIKENLRRDFGLKANALHEAISAITVQISNLEGELDQQLSMVHKLHARFGPLSKNLGELQHVELKCREANVEENDYTIYSYEDLEYEFALVSRSVVRKSAFIENQIVARNITNITPAEIEEFESVFRHFDRDNNNTLGHAEFSAALASLGYAYSDEDANRAFAAASNNEEAVDFEQFIRFVISIVEDKTSPDQLHEAFRHAAGEKSYVTELDLRMAMIPESSIEYLKHAMPQMEDGYDYTRYLGSVFAK